MPDRVGGFLSLSVFYFGFQVFPLVDDPGWNTSTRAHLKSSCTKTKTMTKTKPCWMITGTFVRPAGLKKAVVESVAGYFTS